MALMAPSRSRWKPFRKELLTGIRDYIRKHPGATILELRAEFSYLAKPELVRHVLRLERTGRIAGEPVEREMLSGRWNRTETRSLKAYTAREPQKRTPHAFTDAQWRMFICLTLDVPGLWEAPGVSIEEYQMSDGDGDRYVVFPPSAEWFAEHVREIPAAMVDLEFGHETHGQGWYVTDGSRCARFIPNEGIAITFRKVAKTPLELAYVRWVKRNLNVLYEVQRRNAMLEHPTFDDIAYPGDFEFEGVRERAWFTELPRRLEPGEPGE